LSGAPRLGVDTGGTFTDGVTAAEGGGWRVHKTPTTPREPGRAVLACARALLCDAADVELIHGTTHATNALLTGRLGRAVFVTDAGFGDLLAVGRQERAALHALEPSAARPPLPRARVVEHASESAATDAIADTVRRVAAKRPRAVALCLLRAWTPGPAQRRERALAAALRRALGAEVPVFSGHEHAPEIREYERGVTVWAHAALAPVVGPALRKLALALERAHPGSALRVMRSDGGTAAAPAAAAEPAALALSGPAAGLCAARALADARGDGAVLTFDMGGTSTDCALLPPGELPLVPVTVGGLPLLVRGMPMHTVGTGGGSFAWRDAAGELQVGPDSAGAQPGPACYGRGGTRATVTDAHLAAGRLHPDFFLGGGFALHADRAAAALAEIGARPAEVLEIATAGMERALRRVSLGEGWDQRVLTLYSFGGAGGLHACWLAARLGIRRVVVPPLPGAFCALGLLAAPPRRTLTHSVRAPVPTAASARRARSCAPRACRRARSACTAYSNCAATDRTESLHYRMATPSSNASTPSIGDASATRVRMLRWNWSRCACKPTGPLHSPSSLDLAHARTRRGLVHVMPSRCRRPAVLDDRARRHGFGARNSRRARGCAVRRSSASTPAPPSCRPAGGPRWTDSERWRWSAD
jgi:N-methylhydantoinase A